MNYLLKWELFLILGFFLHGIESQAVCYNHNYEDVRVCEHGCCGTEFNTACCLPKRLIAFAVVGGVFFIGLAAITAVICYNRHRALQRVLLSGNRLSITNDRTLTSQQVTMVNNNPTQPWSPRTYPSDPPPYTGPPPSYSDVSIEVVNYTNTHQAQPAPPVYTQQRHVRGNSQSLQQAPPAYGVYADLQNSRSVI